MMNLRFHALLLGLLAASLPGTAAAQTSTDSPEPHPSSQVGVGLLLGAGLHTGLAGGARLSLGDFGLELSGGYELLLALWQDRLSSETGNEFRSSGQLTSELYWTPWHPLESSAIGLKSGYRYNSVLTHGFSVAITFLVDLNPSLALEVLAGAAVYPGQGDRLRRKLGVPSGAHVVYGSAYQLFEYGVELIWYP